MRTFEGASAELVRRRRTSCRRRIAVAAGGARTRQSTTAWTARSSSRSRRRAGGGGGAEARAAVVGPRSSRRAADRPRGQGAVAAVDVPALARMLVARGFEVAVMMTESAHKFVTAESWPPSRTGRSCRAFGPSGFGRSQRRTSSCRPGPSWSWCIPPAPRRSRASPAAPPRLGGGDGGRERGAGHPRAVDERRHVSLGQRAAQPRAAAAGRGSRRAAALWPTKWRPLRTRGRRCSAPRIRRRRSRRRSSSSGRARCATAAGRRRRAVGAAVCVDAARAAALVHR